MRTNIILAGVGGQGILSIAYIIDNAALAQGFQFKQAEVHGMSQRGGAVQSHIRIADRAIHSDLIPQGAADMILSVEPLEALRYCSFLKPQGRVIASITPTINIPNYPSLDDLCSRLDALPYSVLIDSDRLAKAAGSGRAQNTVMLGAAAPDLPLSADTMLTFVRQLFHTKGENIININLRAFALGLSFGLFYRESLRLGLSPRILRLFLNKVSPQSLRTEAASAWAKLLTNGYNNFEIVLANLDKEINATPELAKEILAAGSDLDRIRRALEA